MSTERRHALSVLAMNTLAFTVCFSVWVMYGVLVTYLVDNKIFAFDKAQMGWLIGVPILTGSIFRLPIGILTDKYGGRPVFAAVLVFSSIAAYFTSYADSFWELVAGGLGFGMAGTGFAVGIAYTSVWFPRSQQGTALGIFGAGNAGAAITSLLAPKLLAVLTEGGRNLEGWRNLPRVYAAALLLMAVVFWLFTHPRRVEHGHTLTLRERLAPLKVVRVWRFGLYYFLVFGGFVALAGWLIPYYVNVYAVSVATAGALAALFSLPSGLIRALGGWLSDRFGARTVMYWILSITAVCCALLVVPRMDVYAPGEGVMATAPGVVERVTETELQVAGKVYPLRTRPAEGSGDREVLIWPAQRFWNEAVVKPGDAVVKRQLLARGVTHIYFQANIWIFTLLVMVVGVTTGIGKAAVYKHIPEYFPKEVGVVGGVVGVIGGLGGFFGPIAFGYMLKWTGIWTTCWMVLAVLSVGCLAWMHVVIRSMMRARAPHLAEQIESPGHPAASAAAAESAAPAGAAVREPLAAEA